MDILIRLTEVLVWPVVVIILAFLFKREVSRVFKRLAHIKYKDLEATFTEGLREAERLSKTMPISLHKKPLLEASPQVENGERLERLLDISPRAAIMEAWIDIESAITSAAEHFGIQGEIPRGRHQVIQYLSQEGIFKNEVVETYNRLRSLRNEAAHAPDLTLSPTEATRYVDLAKGLSAYIKYRIKQPSSQG